MDNTLYCQGIMETVINCENVSRAGKHLRIYLTDKANTLGCQVHECSGQRQKTLLLTAKTICRIDASLVPIP